MHLTVGRRHNGRECEFHEVAPLQRLHRAAASEARRRDLARRGRPLRH